MLFGLHMTGILKISWLDYDLHPENKIDENRSFFSSILMGICFSAGWSPCVGPVLGSILTLALDEGSLQQGFYLLSAYSVGFTVPFLIMALGVSWISSRMRSLGRITRVMEIIMGLILIIVGGLLFFGIYEQIARIGFLFDFGL